MKIFNFLCLLLLFSCNSKREINRNDIIGSRSLYVWVEEFIDIHGYIPTKDEFLIWNNEGIVEFFCIEYNYSKNKALKELKNNVINMDIDYEEKFGLDTLSKTDAISTTIQSRIIASNYLSNNKSIEFENQDTMLVVKDKNVFSKKGEIAFFCIKSKKEIDNIYTHTENDTITDIMDYIDKHGIIMDSKSLKN